MKTYLCIFATGQKNLKIKPHESRFQEMGSRLQQLVQNDRMAIFPPRHTVRKME